MVLVKILSKNVTITINVLLEINLVKRKLNCLSTYGNGIEREIHYFINWDIAMKAQKYICRCRRCDLCICEKPLITRGHPNVLLNKRDELVSKCCHRNKFTLKCFQDRQENLHVLVYVIIFVFFFLGINIVEHHLMIGDMKHSVMVIRCC